MKLRVFLAVLLAAYLGGFAVFAFDQPGPAPDTPTDAIIVPTGAAGRIDRGLDLLRRHLAQRMLISGVDPRVDGATLARQYQAPAALFDCCIDLGRQAVDTRGNADEAVSWIGRHEYRSVRLVTSDWHLWRAELELTNALGPNVRVIGDAVPSNPRSRILFFEYNKLLIRFVVLKLGLPG